jgi:hypothetical protein
LSPRITLTVPSPDRVGHPDTETDPGRLKSRADALPFACPGDAATQLLRLVGHLNRLPPPVAKRVQLMASLQGACDRLYRSFLDQTLEGAPHIDDKRYARLRTQMEGLAKEMAFGYKLAIQPRSGERRTHPFAGTFYHAIRMLETELLLACAAYRPPPGGVWREICQLYEEAERRELIHGPVTDPSWSSTDKPDIQLLFKRVVLLALLDPYRLPPGDIWYAHGYLSHWVSRTVLTSITGATRFELGGKGLIDLRGDHSPRRLGDEPLPEAGQVWRVLDPSGLQQPLETHLESLQASDGRTPKGLEGLDTLQATRLLLSMAHAWLQHWTRSSPRHERYEWLAVACGLSAIVKHLHSNSDEPPDFDENHHADRLRPLLRCQQFNRSAQGLGMRVQLPLPPELTVGQLVLLPSPESHHREGSLMGVVRRMIKRYRNLAEVGIELIDSAVKPAAIRPVVFGRTGPADFQPALAVETSESDRRGALIVPANVFRPGRELVMRLDTEYMRVAPGRLLESTPAFEHFEYRVTMRDISGDV